MTFLSLPQGDALGWENKRPFGAKAALLTTACIATICLTACRPAGPERVPVSGSVTFKGQPIREGQILFLPTKETGGPTSGSYIVNGKYQANLKGGVPVGTHNVKILAWQMLQSSSTKDGGLGGASRGPQYLPDKYNKLTELQITIPSGSEPIVRDYALTP